MNIINCIIVLMQTTFTIATVPPIDIVFIIQQSQNNKYQHDLSRKLKESIIKQSVALQSNFTIKVHLLDEIFNYPGGWTIHNLIPQLMLLPRKHNIDTYTKNSVDRPVINDNTRWIVFCEEKTKVKVKLLIERLNDENHTQPLFLGYPLYDREPTIIHHFAFFENPKWFPYPMVRAGVILSMPLLERIAEIYAHQNNKHFKQQFSIDAGHELARFIYDNIHLPATILTASQQIHENKNHQVNVYQHTSYDTTTNKDSPQAPYELQNTTNLTPPGAFNTDGTSKVSDMSRSDFRITTTNKIIDRHKNKISNPSSNTSTSAVTATSFIKKKKIILKKAAYICPGASREATSRSSNINKNNFDDESCAMYAESMTNAASMTCTSVKPKEIYFAVKTCSKYHNERLPIIQTTWAPYAKHVKYFSDFQDDKIPTTNTRVPNVETGHCAKTLQILKLSLKDIENYNSKRQQVHHINQAKEENHQIKWLFLTDDDTILSISGVCEVLGCYNAMDEIYMGERYGYRLYDQDGFNYITGGGGIAFSLPVVKLILQHCSCPSPTSPDDMILGSCLHSLQLKALHSSRFHQARPNDYPLELLQLESPISFHKFWQLDPVDVYNRWFASQDRQLLLKETANYKKCNDHDADDYCFKTRKVFTKTEPLILNKIPVSLMTSLDHSKERHVDL